MGRCGLFGFAFFIAFLIFMLAGLLGCSSSSAVGTTSFAVPASIALAPTPNASMEIGTYQAFLAAAGGPRRHRADQAQVRIGQRRHAYRPLVVRV